MAIFFLQNEVNTGRMLGSFQAVAGFVIFFRERNFSLRFREIGQSEFVWTRRKVALCIEAYAWAPDLRSFDKLHEVGDLSYLVFTIYLSVL